MTDEAKKIIVDEDWKSQVQREKEEGLGQKQPHEAAPRPGTPAAEALPPATLGFLVSSFYLQAAISLGLLPNPLSGKSEANLAQARHTIDLLEMLQAKTRGNRTPEETEELDAALHQLRLAYVEVQSQPKAE